MATADGPSERVRARLRTEALLLQLPNERTPPAAPSVLRRQGLGDRWAIKRVLQAVVETGQLDVARALVESSMHGGVPGRGEGEGGGAPVATGEASDPEVRKTGGMGGVGKVLTKCYGSSFHRNVKFLVRGALRRSFASTPFTSLSFRSRRALCMDPG